MNNSNNVVQEKSYKFALKIIRLYKSLQSDREYKLADQVMRSGTSIGANIEEALGGTTKKDFAARIQISYREARETLYWLNLLKDSGIIVEAKAQNLIKDANELCKLLASIHKTTLRNIHNS